MSASSRGHLPLPQLPICVLRPFFMSKLICVFFSFPSDLKNTGKNSSGSVTVTERLAGTLSRLLPGPRAITNEKNLSCSNSPGTVALGYSLGKHWLDTMHFCANRNPSLLGKEWEQGRFWDAVISSRVLMVPRKSDGVQPLQPAPVSCLPTLRF